MISCCVFASDAEGEAADKHHVGGAIASPQTRLIFLEDHIEQATRIGGQRRHGFGRRREKDGVDRRLVLEGDRGDGRGHGEYAMEVWNRQ